MGTNIEFRNVRGVGGFKNIALRKFMKDIKPKYEKHCRFVIVLCSDTDVFEFSSRPPIVWGEVERELKENGAEEVIHLQAKHFIEDWFLHDLEGILSFLRLPKNTKISGKYGYDKLQKLYKQANKVYYKGLKSNGMIGRLNMETIVNVVKKELNPLLKVLGAEEKCDSDRPHVPTL